MTNPLSRKRFLAGALGAGGGMLGVALLGRRNSRKHTAPTRPSAGTTFHYDLGPYMDTDPALDMYREQSTRLRPGMRQMTCIAVDESGRVFVGGDRRIDVFSASGRNEAHWTLGATPRALHVDDRGRVIIATLNAFQVREVDGKVLATSAGGDASRRYTSIASLDESVYLADAKGKRVLVFDMDGAEKKVITAEHNGDASGRFIIPSPYFDIAASSDGLLHVANTGRHQIETYTTDGRFVSAWGHASMGIEGFSGCCNPADFVLLPDGRYATSEKGLNRIKIHKPEGDFIGVVANSRALIEDEALSAKACRNCSIGYGIDLAADRQGNIYALDPASNSVRVFSPRVSS